MKISSVLLGWSAVALNNLLPFKVKKIIIIIMYISHFYVLSSVKIIYLFKINAYLVGHMDNFSLQCNQKRIGTG
jgi:hypothetical protein